MAIGFNLPSPTFDRARNPQPAPSVPHNPPAGSLVVIDSFQDGFSGAAHGNVGIYAAQRQGFQGRVYTQSIDSPGVSSLAETMTGYLNSQPLPAEEAQRAVEGYARHSFRGLLDTAAADLNHVRDQGLHDSAVNISYSVSAKVVAEEMYRRVRSNNQPGDMDHQYATNVLHAYGIDGNKLDSPNMAVAGPERARLQQSLLDASERALHAPDVQRSQSGYDHAVDSIQSHHNSVVVAAGNDELRLARLARDAGGRTPRLSADASHNLLANHAVTTVGATQWLQNGRERIAPYSNLDPEVDIYASGAVGNGLNPMRKNVDGTSFAAPRVAAAMATLHGTHPGLSHSATQNLMRHRLTHETEGVSVLDYHQTEEYLRNGTF